MTLHGAARTRAALLGIETMLVSISHTRENAHAVAVGGVRAR